MGFVTLRPMDEFEFLLFEGYEFIFTMRFNTSPLRALEKHFSILKYDGSITYASLSPMKNELPSISISVA